MQQQPQSTTVPLQCKTTSKYCGTSHGTAFTKARARSFGSADMVGLNQATFTPEGLLDFRLGLGPPMSLRT